jgi:hypothetical protein
VVDLLKYAGLGLIVSSLPAATASSGAPETASASTNSTLIGNMATTTLVTEQPTGLTDLPYELRRKIYRTLFRFEKPVEIGSNDHEASAQSLRANKLIEREGTEILYGENSFHFKRDPRTRGQYFERVWKEIAYKDVRRFIEAIGPVNIGKLKHVSFQLTDCANNRSRLPPDQFVDRRFVEDPNVHEVFRLIGANATLTTIGLQFAGRAYVCRIDRSFLRAVSEVKAHSVVTMHMLRGLRHRCDGRVFRQLKELVWVRDAAGERVVLDRAKDPVKMIWDGMASGGVALFTAD